MLVLTEIIVSGLRKSSSHKCPGIPSEAEACDGDALVPMKQMERARAAGRHFRRQSDSGVISLKTAARRPVHQHLLNRGASVSVPLDRERPDQARRVRHFHCPRISADMMLAIGPYPPEN